MKLSVRSDGPKCCCEDEFGVKFTIGEFDFYYFLIYLTSCIVIYYTNCSIFFTVLRFYGFAVTANLKFACYENNM